MRALVGEDMNISHAEDFLLAKLDKDCKVLAIEGRCASGKTTLAMRLRETTGCCIVCIDHFFLPPHMKTAERMAEIGGNIDYDRFAQEVLRPISNGADFSYRPYNCKTDQFDKPIHISIKPAIIIEGVYSLHPKFSNYYDFSVFLDIDKDEQLRRLAKRNPDILHMFEERWIPMEEDYFAHFNIEKTAKYKIIAPAQS